MTTKEINGPVAKLCIWAEDMDGTYNTDCGCSFVMNAGTPEENDMKFCCYCGKELTAIYYAEELE